MANVVGAGGPVLMNDPFDFSGLSNSVGTGIPTATNFATLNLSVGGLWQFQGAGFGNFVGGIATVGTITEFSFTRLSSRVATFSGLSLPMNTLLTLANQNNLPALLNIMFGGDDAITGSAQDDFLFGYGGINALSGGDGNDNLLAGDAMDILDGGAADHAANCWAANCWLLSAPWRSKHPELAMPW